MVISPARTLLSTLAIACSAACLAPAAQADTLKLLTTTYGHRNIDTSLTGYESVAQYVAEWNGSTFATYCTDIFEPFAFNVAYTDYHLAQTGEAGGFTSAQADLLGKLYTVADNGVDAKVDTLDETVAFQLAVWEVMNETNATLKISGSDRGLFYTQNGASNAVKNLTNSWLRAAQGATVSEFRVTRLVSNGHQDMIMVAEIPEPATYALMGAGLAAVAFVARRRKQVKN